MFKQIKNLLPFFVVIFLLPGSVSAQKYPYFTKASSVKIFPVFEVTITDKKTPKGRIANAIQTKRKMYLESVLVTKSEEGKLSPYMNHQLITRSVKRRSFRYTLIVRPDMVFIYKIPSLFSKESKPQLSFSPSSKNLLIRLDEDLTDSISPSSSLSFKNASFAVLDVSEFGSMPQVKLGGIIPEQEPQPKADEEPQQADPASTENDAPMESTTSDEVDSVEETSEESSTTGESPSASESATEEVDEKTQEENPEESPETTN